MTARTRSAARIILAMITLVCFAGLAVAQDRPADHQDAVQPDHAMVFEFGGAGDWSHADGFHAGGTCAVEFTPVEHWLELETGVTAIRPPRSTEWSADLLFKKPWQFSRTVEFMAGVGPELVHATGPDAVTFWGVEAAGDLMVWPRKNVGWYLEPGYEMTTRDGVRHHGLEMAAGVIIGR